MNPKISIITPCFNAEKFIQETIDSVLNQTYQNFEFIIIDDGSTDKTSEILNQQRDRRIKVISHENQGYIKTRNIGFKMAQGEYLLFLDSDDKIAPTYIEKCLNILEQKPNVSIAYSKAKVFDAKNKEWQLPEFMLPDFLFANCIFVSSVIRKKDFEEVGGFDESLTAFEDWDLFISIIKKGGLPFRIPEHLFFYRKRKMKNSITNQINKNKIEFSNNYFKIYCKHYDFYIKNHIYLQDIFSYRETYEKYHNKKWYKKYFYFIFNREKYNLRYKKTK